MKRKGEDEKEGEVDGQVSFLVRTRRSIWLKPDGRERGVPANQFANFHWRGRRPGIKTARQMRSGARMRGQSVSAVRLRARSIWSPVP